MVRGLARPFAARLFRQQSGFSIVPLDRAVRQPTITPMGFNRRKMQDQRPQLAEKEPAASRATDAQVLEDAERLIGLERAPGQANAVLAANRRHLG
jgi:hypothetical protein